MRSHFLKLAFLHGYARAMSEAGLTKEALVGQVAKFVGARLPKGLGAVTTPIKDVMQGTKITRGARLPTSWSSGQKIQQVAQTAKPNVATGYALPTTYSRGQTLKQVTGPVARPTPVHPKSTPMSQIQGTSASAPSAGAKGWMGRMWDKTPGSVKMLGGAGAAYGLGQLGGGGDEYMPPPMPGYYGGY